MSLISDSVGVSVEEKQEKALRYRNVLIFSHTELAMFYFQKTLENNLEHKSKAFRSTSVWANLLWASLPANRLIDEGMAGQPQRWRLAQLTRGQALPLMCIVPLIRVSATS